VCVRMSVCVFVCLLRGYSCCGTMFTETLGLCVWLNNACLVCCSSDADAVSLRCL